jgi:hypothetical protein
MKRIISVALSLIVFITVIAISTSCKSRKSACVTNGPYKTQKMKKNKNKYGSRYGYKAKPVRKTYVIKNKRR